MNNLRDFAGAQDGSTAKNSNAFLHPHTHLHCCIVALPYFWQSMVRLLSPKEVSLAMILPSVHSSD
jgi:hypothetical protein